MVEALVVAKMPLAVRSSVVHTIVGRSLASRRMHINRPKGQDANV